ncbi:MAG: dihydroorotate dehydrogenase electron transfer subunit [Lentisphaerae bacterium]|nr:dihydroorotate dehydrogenase electron transfer subunit [Lentisphaerota bacterium]
MYKNGEIISNRCLKGDYFQVVFYHPEIAAQARPGQFVHVQISSGSAHILRRPFSINNTDPAAGTVQVTYKVVGSGTSELSGLGPGSVCDLMGPLGNGYIMPEDDEIPVMIAGGYGTAAMFMISKLAKNKGILLVGARSDADLILLEDYAQTGCEVRAATNDGSVGTRGFVTVLLEDILKNPVPGRKYRFYACGPTPMLLAAGKMLCDAGREDGELSLDHVMCCGVGACFACVVKVKDGDSFRYARSCSEGPVFSAGEVYYEN